MTDRPQLLTPADLPQLAQAITILQNDAVLLRHEGDTTTAATMNIAAGRLQYIYQQLSATPTKRQTAPDRHRAAEYRTGPQLDTLPGKRGRYHATGYGDAPTPREDAPEPQQHDAPEPKPEPKPEPEKQDRPKRDRHNLPPLPHPPVDDIGDCPQFYNVQDLPPGI